MPFQIVPTIAKAMKDVRASISYRRNLNTKKATSANPKLVVGIPQAVMNGFKPKANDLYALMAGTGADKGRARIVATKAGGVAPRILKGGAVFRFGFCPMLGSDAAEKEFVAVKSIDGGFEIELPAWFKADT